VGFASHSFSGIFVRYSTTQSLFPIASDPKLTAEALGFGFSAPKKISAPLFQCQLAKTFQQEPNASAVSLGSLAPENMRQVQRNWPKLAENERAQSLALRHFYECLRGKTNFGQIAWKQACTSLI